MKLNDTEYCRTFAFVELLKLTLAQDGKTSREGYEPDVEGEARLPKLSEGAIKALQLGTCENASHFAQQNFPHVQFEPWEYMFGVNASKYDETPADEIEPSDDELELLANQHMVASGQQVFV